jgi:hypothetical protein
MNAPDGKFDATALRGFTPRQKMLVDTVHECAVGIEKEGR